MFDPRNIETDYENPIEIAEGVYWVGFYDPQSGLHCNPYLIIDGDEALVIDGGSRPDFSTVMMKILQTGIAPGQIKALLYQHYDPDLCGSIPNFEDIIKRDDLKIISATANLMFIRHYSVSSRLHPISKMDYQFSFSSGRTLQFIKTPYAHSGGSFATFDPTSGVLFSSDLFGGWGSNWELFLNLPAECCACMNFSDCQQNQPNCPILDILDFHRKIMPATKSLRLALQKFSELPFKKIAPQHGSIIRGRDTIRLLYEKLFALEDIGIDGIVKEHDGFKLDHILEQLDANES